jgi:hypothetical protein
MGVLQVETLQERKALIRELSLVISLGSMFAAAGTVSDSMCGAKHEAASEGCRRWARK